MDEKTRVPDLRQPVLICASCWRIQPPQDHLMFEFDQWVEPSTFMAWSDGGTNDYLLVDGYCDSCLSDMASQADLQQQRQPVERLNA
jgi:hypothetical protein